MEHLMDQATRRKSPPDANDDDNDTRDPPPDSDGDGNDVNDNHSHEDNVEHPNGHHDVNSDGNDHHNSDNDYEHTEEDNNQHQVGHYYGNCTPPDLDQQHQQHGGPDYYNKPEPQNHCFRFSEFHSTIRDEHYHADCDPGPPNEPNENEHDFDIGAKAFIVGRFFANFLFSVRTDFSKKVNIFSELKLSS